MRSLWNDESRVQLLARIGRLLPDSPSHWGRMTATQMVAHLNDGFRMAFGELPTRPRGRRLGRLLRLWPFNLLAASFLPFARGLPTAPELLARVPGSWDSEVRALRSNLATFAERDLDGPWADHPFFGSLPGWAWGILGYRHIAHHLRQFGV